MIDKNKKYKTRDDREVRIYATDGGGLRPVHGAVKDGSLWFHQTWTFDGFIRNDGEKHCADLIEIKLRIKREVWLHIFNNGDIIVKEHPAECEIGHRIACVKVVIDCEEGEGL